jgi:hypothetical protein
MLTFRFGLFRFVAPSNASPSSRAKCAEPMSTRQLSPLRPITTPTTDSCGAGTYYPHSITQLAHKISGLKTGLTRRELVSTHHLLLLAEWFTVPALVDIIEFVEDCDRDDDIWSSPGPSLRFTC